VRDLRSRHAGAFETPKDWRPEELPQEFRFITHDTTLAQLNDRLGPSKPVGSDAIIRYDLPSGGAICVFLQLPFSSNSKVRGVQFYPQESLVPVFPS
jgi:hypothetical protein